MTTSFVKITSWSVEVTRYIKMLKPPYITFCACSS